MREIELVSLEDVPRRVENVKRSLEYIYGVELTIEFEEVPHERLYPHGTVFGEGQARACLHENCDRRLQCAHNHRQTSRGLFYSRWPPPFIHFKEDDAEDHRRLRVEVSRG